MANIDCKVEYPGDEKINKQTNFYPVFNIHQPIILRFFEPLSDLLIPPYLK